jgi:glycosyltransferase involved in cell wall biosynthesis
MTLSSSADASSRSIFLLCRSLDIGGAERQLVQLALGLDRRGYKVTVGLFYCGGVLDRELTERGIPIVDLGKRGRWDFLGFLLRLRAALRAARPDLVYSFLGDANILAAAVRPFVPRSRLLWSLRASNVDLGRYGWASRAGYWIERALARSPDLIVSNSRAGLEHAVRHGFPRERIVVVPNGIDTGRFRPDASARRAARERWGLGENEVAIGILARIQPMKDHPTFLRAAAAIAAKRPAVRFLCIGEGPDDYRRGLEALAAELGLAGRLLWPGPAADPVPALNGLDILCSSSSDGEGFSNSVAEAMACGRLCVVTDVGDSATVVGDAGWVVPPRNPAALASALLEALDRLGPAAGASARERVVEQFSVDRMVERTIRCFEPA